MQYTLDIPVNRHVKNYILTRYPQEPMVLNKKNKFGKMIYMALEKMPLKKNKDYPKLDDQLSIKVGPYYFQNKGIYISPDNVRLINEIIEDEIYNELFMYLENQMVNLGRKPYNKIYIPIRGKSKEYHTIPKPELFDLIEVDRCIRDFLDKYNLVGTKITFDGLKKAYQRRLKAS